MEIKSFLLQVRNLPRDPHTQSSKMINNSHSFGKTHYESSSFDTRGWGGERGGKDGGKTLWKHKTITKFNQHTASPL